MRLILVRSLFLAVAILVTALPSWSSTVPVLSCNSGQSTISSSGVFTLGFSCTESAQSVLVPCGEGSTCLGYISETLTTYDYNLVLLSAPIDNFTVTGTYIQSPGITLNWSLTGIGNSLQLVAQGYVETLNLLTGSGSGHSFDVLVPGPVPELDSLLLLGTGLIMLAGWGIRRML